MLCEFNCSVCQTIENNSCLSRKTCRYNCLAIPTVIITGFYLMFLFFFAFQVWKSVELKMSHLFPQMPQGRREVVVDAGCKLCQPSLFHRFFSKWRKYKWTSNWIMLIFFSPLRFDKIFTVQSELFLVHKIVEKNLKIKGSCIGCRL